MDGDAAGPVNRFILYLYPSEFPVFIRHQIKWRMLGHRVQYHEPLLKQIKLSLQNTQIALYLGMVHIPC